MKLTNAVVRFFLALSLFWLMACDAQSGKQSESEGETSRIVPQSNQRLAPQQARGGRYYLSAPDQKYLLPDELKEVSGLSYGGNGAFFMVQDEEGIVFTWDEKSQGVLSAQPFGKPDDYEGIEVVKGQIFVVKNTGTLFYMNKSSAESLEAVKVGTFLKGDNDVEGLGYLPGQDILLLACKAPFLENGESKKAVRSIYAFDLKSKSLRPTAWLYLNMYQLEKDLEALPQTAEIKKIWDDFDPEKPKCLAPSGIAVHPLSGEVYVLAHRSEMLLVLSETGKVLDAYHLDRELFAQPEGICFKENGDLYISNEGVDGQATLLGFNYNP